MVQAKTGVRLTRFADLDFQPRFEHGDQAQLAEVAGAKDGTELGVGFARMTGARIDWTIKYDEVLMVLDGRLKVHCGGEVHELGPRDCLWLPTGSAVTYEAEEALITYAIHPADWADRQGA